MSADQREQHDALTVHECTLFGLLLHGEAVDGGLRCVHGYTIEVTGGEIRDSSGQTYRLGAPEEAR